MEVSTTHASPQVYTLLTNNYVEDDDAMFRFDYSPAFLAWALLPPGYRPTWHVGTQCVHCVVVVSVVCMGLSTTHMHSCVLYLFMLHMRAMLCDAVCFLVKVQIEKVTDLLKICIINQVCVCRPIKSWLHSSAQFLRRSA